MLNDMQYAKIVDNHKVRIGYCGSPSHKGDFDHYICKALRKLKEKYGVQLIMFGYNPISGAEDLYFPGCEVHEYLDTINNLDLDIGIAPLADDEFNRAKSNLKFLEYTYCSIPTVASSVYPYKHTITHNENGILIENSKQWYDELEKLVLDKRKRIELIVNARKFVSDNFTFKNNGDLIISKWEKIISEMYK
jgi:glycosyltransferase involved in cell wall biosynthesis